MGGKEYFETLDDVARKNYRGFVLGNT
jgi:hypothetical protein